jgi:hypothetical protein
MRKNLLFKKIMDKKKKRTRRRCRVGREGVKKEEREREKRRGW